jgi:hypothetical protein
MASKTALAWAAGFLDGEGSFLVSDRKHRQRRRSTSKYSYFRISASQKDSRVLHKLRAILGGKIYGPHSYKRKNRTEIRFQFQIDGDSARAAYVCIKPFLSEMKKSQAKAALSFLRG